MKDVGTLRGFHVFRLTIGTRIRFKAMNEGTRMPSRQETIVRPGVAQPAGLAQA